MQCPRCQSDLRERDRETAGGEVVVIDVCPKCGGVWLDKGELEKLTRAESRGDERRDDEGHGGGEHGGRRGGRRREGFFGNLFDFD